MSKFGSNAFSGSGHEKISANEQEQRIRELEKENREQQKTIEMLKDAVSFTFREQNIATNFVRLSPAVVFH